MSPQYIRVVSSDPTLAPYLAHHLQEQSCSILEEDGKFFLCSSYFEKLPSLLTATQRIQYSEGFGHILELVNSEFDKLSPSEKIEICINSLLLVLNGIIKLKYKNFGILQRPRFYTISSGVVETEDDYEIDKNRQRNFTVHKQISVRAVIGAGDKFFRTADEQQPGTKEVWNIARNSGSVARALYHYANSEDLVELRKVVEEIIGDTNTQKTGRISFKNWLTQKWSEPEISMEKVRESYALLHNPLMLGKQALHSIPFANEKQANDFKSSGKIMPLSEARDIIHMLLMKWVRSKYNYQL